MALRWGALPRWSERQGQGWILGYGKWHRNNQTLKAPITITAWWWNRCMFCNHTQSVHGSRVHMCLHCAVFLENNKVIFFPLHWFYSLAMATFKLRSKFCTDEALYLYIAVRYRRLQCLIISIHTCVLVALDNLWAE